ncbi:MAG: PHP domain-containing protein [Ardenticatenaceae bacterium]|nr:PHP domain-containing protein [Ardenticatenaceae bacterium]
MIELAGNMHMHTHFSDGEKWHAEIAQDAIAAGLDFIIVTDHNVWVDGVEGYYEGENGRLLLLSGEEVHNVRRQPQGSHLLVYGAEAELADCAPNPQQLIDAVNERGGYSFLAHPHENDCRIFPFPNLGWRDWPVENFTGLEIWNYMSSFINALVAALDRLPVQIELLDKLTAVRLAFNPQKFVVGPEPRTLALWDELLAQGKRITAVGNSDAHATPMSFGPFKRIIFPYEYLFRAVNTHILLERPLTGDLTQDKKMILRAIGKGNSWVGYDLPHSTKGFRFSAASKGKGIMGEAVKLDAGATLQICTPTRCNIRLIHNGKPVASAKNETHLTHIPIEPGAYRVECTIQFAGQERGWIYSNPIYLY